jgi:hypothetical protein
MGNTDTKDHSIPKEKLEELEVEYLKSFTSSELTVYFILKFSLEIVNL